MDEKKIIDFYYVGDSKKSKEYVREFLDVFSLLDTKSKYQPGNFVTYENYIDTTLFNENYKIVFVEDQSKNYTTTQILEEIKNQNKINWTPHILFTNRNNLEALVEASHSRISHSMFTDDSLHGYENIGRCIRDIIKIDFPNLEKMEYDYLTGAYNPSQFKYLFSKEIEKTKRDTEYNFGLCLFDLINFKEKNDTHGHAIGDDLLKKFVKNSKHAIRDLDDIIRRGGDEFLILIRNVKSTESLEIVLNRIVHECIQNPLVTEKGIIIPSTAKYGFGIYRDGDDIKKFEEGIDPKGKEEFWEKLDNGFIKYQFNS